MLSIVDTLERLGINHNVFRINKDDLTKLEFPFLLFLDDKSGKKGILIRNEKDLNQNKEEVKNWNGVVLQVDNDEGIKNTRNDEIKKSISEARSFQLKSKLLAGCGIVLLALALINSFSTVNTAFILTSLVGFLLGYLLIAKELGNTSEIIESFCKMGKKSNCDKILNSKEAKLFGIISFSDIVIIYFCFQLVAFCFSMALPNAFTSFYPLLLAMSLLTLPVILFSVYYQYFRAKVWCPLCLAVDAVLIAQTAILANVFYNQVIHLNNEVIFYTIVGLVIFGIIGLSVILSKDKAEEINHLSKAVILSQRIKYSSDVFTHLLFQQRKIDDSAFNPEILLGNPDAPLRILMVSNFYCNPCKEQHVKIAQLIHTYPEKVAVAIRFVRNGQDFNRSLTTTGYIISYWLHKIYHQSEESSKTEKLLENWYKVMDLEKFIKENLLEGDEKNNESRIIEEQHYKWQEMVGISSTPTFFINGHELPNNYNIEDMMVLTPGLAEYFSMAPDSVLQDVEKN